MAASTCAGSRIPSAVETGRARVPESAAMAPISKLQTWEPASAITSVPGSVWTWMAIWLPIVPVGTKSAASLPMSSAPTPSSRLIVGSSP